ncbi:MULTISPECIES: bacillithiol biosynthesis deacetylase BshB2 [Sutcliffiella]|uniref:Bacillithiol biosynthesis deacetylase BshB2 n=1 Tax=Sutcliffiella cohnii TaxID=33932 RepID=A0A223KQN6_9BACI|nr:MULTISPECIES: bacillithiol biosynthesis deacetylase BshB2 [Sutcliffiella]AST91779.1 bacillithiol biosynthesis deacetylase BshB2 [Sutcliffiella cohnii]MED4018580.1 bacillithiol biosynthesis deacetylase BshB2 [Sutcliffiella cohnii]WBL12998.1 bacillithiol biosynthesis deacetylase BshB2 [Sutcliffiella sp. NC1]
MNQHERVLVVFPHPDDEAFSSSGTIKLFTKSGAPVTYICGTLGQMGRNLGNPLFATRETLMDVRKKELTDACKVMGIEDLRMFGLHDKTVEFENEELLADRIEAVIKEVKPTLLITFYPKHGVHPDHDAMSNAAVIAVKRLPKEEQPTIYGKAILKNSVELLGEPDITIDIKEVALDKLNAIKAHRSQTESWIETMEQALEANSPEVEDWLYRETFWTYNV